jgi:hypothetical protein
VLGGALSNADLRRVADRWALALELLDGRDPVAAARALGVPPAEAAALQERLAASGGAAAAVRDRLAGRR